MIVTNYETETFSPIFYSSVEGSYISTDDIISSTALTFAIAYQFDYLKERYILKGDDTITHNYEILSRIPIFVTDATPKLVNHTNIGFRSLGLMSERSMVTRDITEKIMGKGPGYKQQRQYSGIDFGSKHTICIISEKELPNEFLLNIGIRRSGEVRFRKTMKDPEEVTLNYYLLKEIYDYDKDDLFKIVEKSSGIEVSSDFRLQHIVGVPYNIFEEKVVKFWVDKWASHP